MEKQTQIQKELKQKTYLAKTVNVAVLGCGIWGRNHTRVLSESQNANLDCVVDINKKIAADTGKRFNVDYSTKSDRIFNDPNIDAVIISTPTVTHAELALMAIEAGKHVLVEKPMTNTLEEAKRLIKAARAANVLLTVGFVERFNPAVKKALELVDEGAIGKVILAHTKRVSRWPIRIGDVGVIKDLAIHDIDIVNQLFGLEAETIFSNAGQIQHIFEDYANILMCFPENKGAIIETNWLTPNKVRTLNITGTDGIIEIEYITQSITLDNHNQIIQPFLIWEEPLRLELESFIHSIVHEEEPIVTGEDGLKALKVCEAAIESAKTGKPVKNNFHSLSEFL